MVRFFPRQLCLLLLSLTFLFGCATVLPPTYETVSSDPVLDGPVRALAGEDDLVAAVNSDGLFVKDGDAPWSARQVPGINKWSRVTCLAVKGNAIYLGSDGEGLRLFSNGVWEVKTKRDGGLPDDGVLSIALESREDGLLGEAVWVGTRQGISVYRDGRWTVYRPDGDWLVAMTGKPGSGAGKVYVGPGFKLGKRDEDSDRFKPPVSVIGVGSGRVVFGNSNSGLAVVTENAVAVLKLEGQQKFTDLSVDKDVIWAGTEGGLLWGGIKDRAAGKPWPTNRAYLNWSGTLFGSRDTRDFEYRWKLVGYNTAEVAGLQVRGSDVWAAHRSKGGNRLAPLHEKEKGTERIETEPITDTRRYINAQEYIARRQKFQHESYGMSDDIKGEPSALYVTPDSRKVWIGTSKGLWELESD